MITNNDLLKLDAKISEKKFSGKLEIYYNSGGKVGFQITKRDKDLERILNEKMDTK